MCGIFAILNAKGDKLTLRRKMMKLIKRIRHRGPDDTGITYYSNGDLHNFIGHERLGIMDPFTGGHQPFFNESGTICSVTNGEIFNYQEIKKSLKGNYKYRSHSDSEVLPFMYNEMGVVELANTLRGQFAILIWDDKNKRAIIIRDQVGICPVYLGYGFEGEFYVSSEMKALHDQCKSVEILMPGHYYDTSVGKQQVWYTPSYYNMDLVPTDNVDYEKLKGLFLQAIERRLMTEVPFGLFLSGGLDSSLVASCVVRHFRNLLKEGKIKEMPKIHSFSIGLSTSPDLKAARAVAEFLGTEHHELVYTIEEGIDHVPDVIYSIESFNPTSIRASTPMYLLSRHIKSYGIKMVLSGEGADEVLGGYLYFHKCPNGREFQQETIRKIQFLHWYDVNRANKCGMAWGVEVRVPFLDRDFVEYAMSVNPDCKIPRNNDRNIEKYILRKAFDDKNDPYLPDWVLWRQKEQFSDGVGYGWIDGLKDLAEVVVSDHDLEKAEKRFPLKSPLSKEAYWYRSIFEEHYPAMTCADTVPHIKSIACSTDKALEWDESFKNNADESARTVTGVHVTSGTKDEMKLKK